MSTATTYSINISQGLPPPKTSIKSTMVFFTQNSFSVFSKTSKVLSNWNLTQKRNADEVDVRGSQVLHTFQNINILGFVVSSALEKRYQGGFQHSATRCPVSFASISCFYIHVDLEDQVLLYFSTGSQTAGIYAIWIVCQKSTLDT